MTDTDKEQEALRREFEEWYKVEHMGNLDNAGLFDEARNCYMNYHIHLAWKAWKARTAYPLKEDNGLIEQINKQFLLDAWVRFASCALMPYSVGITSKNIEGRINTTALLADAMVQELKKRVEGRL